MAGTISFGNTNTRTYKDFKKQIPSELHLLFDSIRDYCFSLADNVIEDVRMHRVVFSKSITFRWFADVSPQKDEIVIKIQKSRKEPFEIINIRSESQLDEIKPILKKALETIR